MKELTNYIAETKTQLSLADKLLCMYFIRGLQETRNKVQLIEDLDSLFSENKDFKKLLFKFIKSITIPGILQVKYIKDLKKQVQHFIIILKG